MTITLQPRRIAFGMAGNQKYRNKPTVVQGVKFASKKEAKRWQDLQLFEAARRVRNIRRQVEYRLEVMGILICKYRADFVFDELIGGAWVETTEDVKGYRTPEYRLKKKLMKACHGIEIRES